ncbi:MAG: insulinase family protein [Bacteroidetes bacterium]|nr:insulinase family protein [Bacteroidota bacterium]
MEYQYHTLNNGIKIIHRQIAGTVSHCGLMVNTGSRDEEENENGIAHLIEHLIFKGTNKRKAYHVLSRIENVGGELNAYTTKEETCIYASFLSQYYNHSLELFADVAFNSIFPQKELDKEKDVVIDEINSYNDSPGELIFDDFEDLIFTGHSLGRNILGSINNIKSIKRKDILRFIKSKYSTEQMVIASVGQIKFSKLVLLAEKYFGCIPASKNTFSRVSHTSYKPSELVKSKNSYLSHCMIGNIAYSRTHPNKLPLLLLSNLLGGPALNSRLSMIIREKYGYAYSIESMYQPYSDTGVFNIYIGADSKHVDKSIALVKKELINLSTTQLGTMQLHRAKRQITGQLAISGESFVNEMLGIAKVYLHKPRVKSIEDIIADIEKITSKQILEVAEDIFNPSQLSTLIYTAEG